MTKWRKPMPGSPTEKQDRAHNEALAERLLCSGGFKIVALDGSAQRWASDRCDHCVERITRTATNPNGTTAIANMQSKNACSDLPSFGVDVRTPNQNNIQAQQTMNTRRLLKKFFAPRIMPWNR
jgi:hypothetical protein